MFRIVHNLAEADEDDSSVETVQISNVVFLLENEEEFVVSNFHFVRAVCESSGALKNRWAVRFKNRQEKTGRQ